MNRDTDQAFVTGVRWRGQRSGHYYVTVFTHRGAAELALQHILVEGSLPDYSPGSYKHEPVGCLELGDNSEKPEIYEGMPIVYVNFGIPPFAED